MKRCPTCNREFADELSFCTDDGTPLAAQWDESPDPEATLVRTRLPATEGAREPGNEPRQAADVQEHPLTTRSYSAGDSPGAWTLPPYQPPGAPPYGPMARRRKIWPWVVASAAIVLACVLAAVALIVKWQFTRLSRNQNENRTAINANANRKANTNALPSPVNSNLAQASPSPQFSPSPAKSGAPADSEAVLSELTDLENEWQEANVNGDRETLDRILADDYVGQSGSGKTHDKRQYLESIKPDYSIKSWEFQDLRLALNGDRAVLRGYVRAETDAGPQTYAFTDTFVWRSSRWQAVGSRTSRVQ